MADTFLQPRAAPSAGDTILGLFSNPFQGQIQIRAFWASLGLSLGASLLLALLFSLLRPRHNLVYAPKTKHTDAKHAPPPIGKGPFTWIPSVVHVKEPVLIEKLGLDAAIFLRFIKMLRNIFIITGVMGLAIMIPVNVTTGASSIQDKSNVFAIMTPLYTWGGGLWAQVVMAYAIDFVVMYLLWHNYRRVYGMRRQYYESEEYQQSLHARSVLIRHIPKNLRSEEGMMRITEQVNPTGSLPIPIAARDVKEIPELMERHEGAVRKLESILAKYAKNPNKLPAHRPLIKAPSRYQGKTVGGKVDAIDYYRTLIERYEQNIAGLRQQITYRNMMSYGFAAWEQVSNAHIVAYTARNKTPEGTKIRQAPRPNDIIWQNMTLEKSSLKSKKFANVIYISLLTVAWTPLNAGLAVFVSNLSNLGSVWPQFQRQLETNKAFWSIVQGIAAPALTSLVYLLLPMIFRRLQIRAGDVTKTQRDRHVLRNLYTFFIINNLVVFSLFSAIWQFITAVINDSKSGFSWNALKNGDFFLTVTTQLCSAISPFWVIWILQRNLGAAIDLAQLWTLFYQWFAKTFLAPTPRQYIEWTAPPAIDYAAYYNYFLFYSTIALCFATLQPIILLCTALYFTFDAILKKYLLMYVFITKNESGGVIWRTLFNRLVFACVLADIIIGVTVKARGSWTMVIALAPLLVILFAFKFYCARTFDPGMDYYQRTISGTDAESQNSHSDPSTKALTRARYKFSHPALDRKLLTPMVSAKARHIIAQIYAGKTTDDLELDHAYDEDSVPMQSFDRKQPPQNTPFEAVPEHQQDFEYFKNRSDFIDAGGDNIHRPEDLITSRPGTPGSMMSMPMRSQTPQKDYIPTYTDRSRSQSPAPRPGEATRRDRTSMIQPNLRSNTPSYNRLQQIENREEDDLAVGMYPRHGPYTDPDEDNQHLLGHPGEIGTRAPNEEFMSLDQWQVTPTPYSREAERGEYDYFRRNR